MKSTNRVYIPNVNRAFQAAGGKLTASSVSNVDISPPAPKIRKTRAVAELGDQFKGADASKVQLVANLLKDNEICVISDYNELSKKQIENKIMRFGGKIVQNPGIHIKIFMPYAHTSSKMFYILTDSSFENCYGRGKTILLCMVGLEKRTAFRNTMPLIVICTRCVV